MKIPGTQFRNLLEHLFYKVRNDNSNGDTVKNQENFPKKGIIHLTHLSNTQL